jgi:hypothetical protein
MMPPSCIRRHRPRKEAPGPGEVARTALAFRVGFRVLQVSAPSGAAAAASMLYSVVVPTLAHWHYTPSDTPAVLVVTSTLST